MVMQSEGKRANENENIVDMDNYKVISLKHGTV